MNYKTFIATLLLAICWGTYSVCHASGGSQTPSFLKQNWNKETRADFYTRSQGSQMMPYKWALALERADSTQWFFENGLERHGYIANGKSALNPNAFPVGFVRDVDPSGEWLGMNCAACHTGQISHKDTLLQIDGAPARADMYGLLTDLEASLLATVSDSKKFDRFARKVLGKGYSPDKGLALLDDVKKFLKYWSSYVKASTSKVKWGHARLDAFGMIYNRVSAIDLHMPTNNRVPDAPVSYPFLWGTSFENVVQWNGSAPNYNKNILIADLQRLARNVGEVLGVFANTDIQKPTVLKPYYVTTARRLNQLHLEGHLMNLWSPQWPQKILGKIDLVKASQGEKLFNKNCVSCHQVIPYGKQKTPVTVTMTPLNKIGTDPKMASNACGRTVQSGILEGVEMPPLIGAPLPKVTPTLDLVANVTIGAILNPHLDSGPVNSIDGTAKDKFAGGRSGLDIARFLENINQQKNKELFANYMKNRPNSSACDSKNPIMAYKGRPLDGIWATAPYLHNGSVANLYEILLPAKDRMKKFKVGSRKFDPKNVGFVTDEGPFELDTSLPGNSNSGHDTYGNAKFTEEERQALVEYLKTL